MAIKGLEQAVENLSRISKTAVPGAAAMAINRVASSAISQSASQVARETKVRQMSSCPYNWRNHGPSGPLFLCGGVHDER
ncbi:phage tail protein [Algoriphagus lutimaris]